MGKLQPNFSWQKYEGAEESQKTQFQFQLQQQHILVANALNATVNDLSYFSVERQTDFMWLNNKPVFTKTFAIASLGTGVTIATGITGLASTGSVLGNFTPINITGYVTNGTNKFTLPYLDASSLANSIGVKVVTANLIIASGGTNYSGYSGNVTMYYIKY